MNARSFFKTACLALLAAVVSAGNGFAGYGDIIDPTKVGEKVILKPGAKGRIEFEQNGNELTKSRWIADSKEEKKGTSIDFAQEQGKKPDDKYFMLYIKNYLPKKLTYRAAIRTAGSRSFRETSLIVPLDSGMGCYESWPDKIEEMLLFGFKLVD